MFGHGVWHESETYILCNDEVDNFAKWDSAPIFGSYESDEGIIAMVEGLYVQLHIEVKDLHLYDD